jgi:transposase
MKMKKRYVVRLSAEEREQLEDLVNRGREAAYRRRHAQILLLADEGEQGSSLMDREVAERVGCTRRTVEQMRERCVCEGLQAALERRKRFRERSRVLDGEGEARLVSLACSEPPEGRSRWTLKMLGDRLVELEVVESISAEAVRLVLKKHHQTLAEAHVVHSRATKRGVRLPDGSGVGGLLPSP